MMSGMSDMVLARNELARRLRQGEVDPTIEAALERLSLTVGEMRDTVTRTRMQKIDALFSALPRMVRDTAAGLGKSVMLQVEGSDVELDREMIEVMRDPLVHIIRNSIDHGIEPPGERRANGKRENGRLSVSARQSGNQIIVEIVDDGRGIDTERLIQKAVAAGRDEGQLRKLSNRAKLDLVFEPGLSSKDVVSDVSGRGVGMDIVRASIEQIGGRIELDSAPGKGLRIAIHVPLTLSIISTIVVGVGGQRFAIPRQAIEEIVTERGDAIRVDVIGGSPVATVRDRRMPLMDLSDMLELPAGASRDEGRQMLAIVSVSEGSYALAVETVLDNEELVIKPASPAVMSTGLYAGQTLPDSGLPMLMLDCAGMAKRRGARFQPTAEQVYEEEEEVAGSTGPPGLAVPRSRRRAPRGAAGSGGPGRAGRGERGALRGGPLPGDDRRPHPAARRAWRYRRAAADQRAAPEGRHQRSFLRDRRGGSTSSCCPKRSRQRASRGRSPAWCWSAASRSSCSTCLWIFNEHADHEFEDNAPLCLIAGDSDGWMASFVKPFARGRGLPRRAPACRGRDPGGGAFDRGHAHRRRGAPVVRLRSRVPQAGRATTASIDMIAPDCFPRSKPASPARQVADVASLSHRPDRGPRRGDRFRPGRIGGRYRRSHRGAACIQHVRGLAALRSRVVTVVDTQSALGWPRGSTARRAVITHVEGIITRCWSMRWTMSRRSSCCRSPAASRSIRRGAEPAAGSSSATASRSWRSTSPALVPGYAGAN
jgi:two-component system chemotaxis sensor kinase CheA